MKTTTLWTLVYALIITSCSTPPTNYSSKPEQSSRRPSSVIFPNEKDAIKVHQALYETFFPFTHVKNKLQNAQTDQEKEKLQEIINLAQAQLDEIYMEVRKMAEINIIHRLFANLDYLTSPIVAGLYYRFMTKETDEAKKKLWAETKQVREYVNQLKKIKKNSLIGLSDLNIPERKELINMMRNSGLNYLRRLAFSTNLLYNSKIYKGQIAKLISGLQVDPHRYDENFFYPNLKFPGHKLTYNKEKNLVDGELDYIIVGSGVAASVIVNRLHAAGKRVLILEKGSFIYPGAINARDNFNFLDSKGLRGDNDGSMFFLNGSVVGGGSTVNIDMSYPPTLPYIKLNFENWREKGLIPQDLWTQEQLADAQKWIESLFNIRTITEDEVNANNHILLRGSLAMGMELTEDQYDLNKGIQKYRLLTNQPDEENQVDGRTIKVTDKKSVVERLLWGPLTNKKSSDGQSETFTVALEPDATVTQVLQQKTKQGKKAIGVEFIKTASWDHQGIVKDPTGLEIPVGKKVKVYAKNVILSAGNLGSTAVLLQSNIKNKNIGRGFTAHPFMPIVGFFDEEVNAHLGTASTYYLDHYLTKEKNKPRPGFLIESAAGNADLGGVVVPGSPEQVYDAVENLKHIGGLGVILVEETNPNNRIEMKGNVPVIFHHLSETDRRRFAKGIAEGIRILFRAGAKKVSFVSYENVFRRENHTDFKFFTSEEDANYVEMNMRFTENQSLIMGAHMLGANKLGVDPAKSVVNPDHQVWGVENLYLVDAGVFPTSPGANPMQSIFAVSKIFVDRHLSKQKSSK